MKIMLLIFTFCAAITTGKGQSVVFNNNAPKTNTAETMDPKKNISGNVADFKYSGIFFKAVQAGDLFETFNNPGPLTLFLPTDTIFNRLNQATLDSLFLPENKYDLISLLTYHALPGEVSAKDIARHIRRGNGKTSFHTIAGAWLKARFDSNGDIVLTDEKGGECTLLTTDIEQKNGLVHLISAVLMPRFQPI